MNGLHQAERGANGRSGAAGLSLVELLVVIVVVGVLGALLVPALSRAKAAARRVQCVGNLRQLGLAGQMYWDDHGGRMFPYRLGSTNGGQVYWFGWLEDGAEGQRGFERAQGVLAPYLAGAGVELCPSLYMDLREFKRKATGAAYGYGYNLHLSHGAGRPPVNLTRMLRPSGMVFLADCAQVNDFQPPASPDRPMLEEFYYVSSLERTAHFRHARRANAVFCDGHVEGEQMAAGTLDPRLPHHQVGQLREEILVER